MSGDFYWVAQKDGYVLVIVADCTGHGVPGAFMSMIGHALLSEIVNEKNILDPAQMLHQLDQGIVKALKQDDPRSQRSDGMDVGICRIDASTREIVFAGANHALYWVTGGKSHFQPGNRYGIGGLQKEKRNLTIIGFCFQLTQNFTLAQTAI
ncbi:MAG: SpoIIE family protein phosphatase [Microscillaceae bacterium]|nr:SpoIIE family protein phosphatase [Microscillaceae bacterium]